MLILIIFMLAMAISMMAVPQRERGRLMLMQFAFMFVFVMLFMGDQFKVMAEKTKKNKGNPAQPPIKEAQAEIFKQWLDSPPH